MDRGQIFYTPDGINLSVEFNGYFYVGLVEYSVELLKKIEFKTTCTLIFFAGCIWARDRTITLV